MRILHCFTLLYIALCLTCCAGKPPNVEIGFTDQLGQANFHYLIQGTDFKVDNSGQHNYTLHGMNLTYDQMIHLFFYMSPWAWGDMKNFFLNYCHQKQNTCNYPEAVAKIAAQEEQIKANMSDDVREKFEEIMRQKQRELNSMLVLQ